METSMEEGDCLSQENETTWNDELDMSQLCRICANPNEYLIPIFYGEGQEHELEKKIAKHLPIKVKESDELPTNLCYQCASTLIAWHDMVEGFVEADEKLKTMSSYKYTKATSKSINKENQTESCIDPQDQNIPLKKINAMAHISQGQDKKPLTSVEKEEIAIEEETTSVKPGMMEEESTDSRCLGTFNAYHQTQVALRMLQWADRGSMFCVLCGKKRENQMLLIKHLYIEHKIHCGHCEARFTSEHELASHISTHGNETHRTNGNPSQATPSDGTNNENTNCRDALSLRCEICSMSFLRRFDLKKHKIKYHLNESSDSNKENGNNNLKCGKEKIFCVSEKEHNISVKENKSLSENETHCMSDSDDSVKEEFARDFVKPEVKLLEPKYVCTLCNYSCEAKHELTLHKQSVHNLRNSDQSSFRERKSHYCDICRSSYSRKADLQRHIHKIHMAEEFSPRNCDSLGDMNVSIINQAKENINGVIVYRCAICGKNLRTKKGFVRHIRVHSGERPFTCHVCGKQYRSNTDLTRHLKCVHEGIKKYPCDICGRFFANKATKNDHRRTHTGEKPFMCDVCGKSFPTPNSIYIHRRTHTNFFPHECKTCEKKFRRKQQLIHHTRTHTGEKPHSCDVCGKCFAVKDEVTRHKLTHSNEKPHVCTVCGFAFGQKRYLTNHTKTHHPTMM